MKDGKIFQKIYTRAKRGKEKGKVTVKLKRLHMPKRSKLAGVTETADQLSSLEEQMDQQEYAGNASLDQNVTNPQVEQVQGDVLVESSTQLEEEALVSSQEGWEVQEQNDDNVQSFDGEWVDSWRSERSSIANRSREKKKAKRRRNRRNKQLKGNKVKEAEPDTLSVFCC